MLVDLFPKEAAEEMARHTDCECCGKRKSDLLYIVKVKNAIVFCHLCRHCVNDPGWTELGESQYINKV